MSQILAVVIYLFDIYQYILIARILMSWVPGMERTGLGQILYRITEPYLSVFRRFIPSIGMIDISPIVAFIALRLIRQGIITIIGTWL